MRRVLFGGAMSLDGFIAGPNGEYDWIVMDPDIDFAEMMGQFDTFLIGRKTFEAMRRMGTDVTSKPGARNIVFSRTLRPGDYPHVTISADAERVVADLQAKPGKDIALFGGGELFRSLLAAGLVDGVGVSLIPVLLGGGIPLLPSPAGRATLKLRKHRVYEKTGTVGLWYDIERHHARDNMRAPDAIVPSPAGSHCGRIARKCPTSSWSRVHSAASGSRSTSSPTSKAASSRTARSAAIPGAST